MEKIKSINDILLTKGQVVRGQCAKVFNFKEELFVVGFVPMSQIFYDNSNLLVCSNFVGVNIYNNKNQKEFQSYPICKKVLTINKCENIYDIETGFVRLSGKPLILECFSNQNYMFYIERYGSNSEKKAMLSLARSTPESFVLNENMLYYKPKAGDWAFSMSEEDGNQSFAISSKYLCLCAYTNPLTGRLEYILLSPDDVIPILTI